MANYYQKIASKYDDIWNVYSERTVENLLQTLSRQKIEFKAVIDYGCGTGSVLEALLKQNPQLQAYGVDPSPNMRKVAIEKLAGFSSVKIIDSSELDSLPQADLVTTTNTLHYFDSPIEILSKLGKKIKPNGLMYLSDYSKKSVLPRFFEWFIRMVDGQHVRAYELQEVIEMTSELKELELLLAQKTDLGLWWRGYELLLKKL